jgi:hypothetical protein
MMDSAVRCDDLRQTKAHLIPREHHTMHTRRSVWVAFGFVLVAAIALTGCPGTPAKHLTIRLRPECPENGEWSRIFVSDTSTTLYGKVPGGELAGSEGITDIVEFHDCQQFIVPAKEQGKYRYSSLFAIFARLRLDRPYQSPDSTTPFDPATMGMPMATIFSYDSEYTQLGIKPGFNCLYFFRTSDTVPSGWEALVLPVPENQQRCARPLSSRMAPGGKLLTVSPAVEPKPGSDTPPPVARWDWDATNHTEYIGIRCGDVWCEVHPDVGSGPGFVSSVPIRSLDSHSKGWYDEQILAVAGNPKGRPPEVSNIIGTLIPADNLGNDDVPQASSRYVNGWINVARVAIRGNSGGYTSKLNLIEAGEVQADNIVALCYVSPPKPNKCDGVDPMGIGCKSDGWYGMVTHSNGTAAPVKAFFCVTRRDHDPYGSMRPHPPIPGIVRWRWALEDETMWIRCLNGCCEVKPHA